jgi:hypothetical protein
MVSEGGAWYRSWQTKIHDLRPNKGAAMAQRTRKMPGRHLSGLVCQPFCGL